MVPLYILGLLKRYGPQHGYQIKKTISESLSDFTRIKLPTIYYHLSKMEADGLLSASSEKPGSRPEKTVYTMTDKGETAYGQMLSDLMKTEYYPVFDNDAVFYFSDHSRTGDLAGYLERYAEDLKTKLVIIERHLKETLRYVPQEAKPMVCILFDHHLRHYRAELDWARETLQELLKEE